MKVIFLDIDGVMNYMAGLHRNGIHFICTERLQLLKLICAATGAKIVLSSTWRILEENRNRVREALATVGLDFQDCTIRLSGPRSREIQHWLETHPTVTKFAVLDDDPRAGWDHNFFQTDFLDGLTIEIAQKIVQHLGARNVEND